MTIHFEFWPALAFTVVMVSWFTFAASFMFFKKPPSPPDKKRDPSSIAGIVLQGISFAIVWTLRRALFTPILSLGKSLEIALAILTMVLAPAPSGFAFPQFAPWSQWIPAARVVEGHKLSHRAHSVAKSIYTGMLGMLLATGFAVTH
jgi:hypothetical protein